MSGSRGPLGKSAAQKGRTGNPGKRRIDPESEQPTALMPKCPSWLPKAAKAEWKRIGPELLRLGYMTVADQQTFAAYCLAVHLMEMATKTLESEGQTISVSTEHGTVIRSHPAVKQLNDALAKIKAHGADFGLTPAARGRVKGTPKEGTKEVDEVEELQRRQQESAQ